MHSSGYKAIAELEYSYWWFVGKRRTIERLIRRYAPDRRPLRSLDVGCGPGGMLPMLGELGEAIGADPSEVALEYCRERKLNAVHAALPDDVPFEDSSFDVIVASEVLEHIDRDAESAAKLVDLLRPGGLLVVTVPAFQWMWTKHDTANHHYRRYTTSALHALFESQQVERLLMSYYNTTFFPVMAAARLGSRIRGRNRSEAIDQEVEIKQLPGPINSLMTAMFAAEGRLVTRMRLPFGGSVVATYRKESDPVQA